MKRFIAALLCVVFLSVVTIGCGDGQSVNGKYCDTYGLLNKESKCKDVQYRTVVGNVVWGILLVETIVAPIYFFWILFIRTCTWAGQINYAMAFPRTSISTTCLASGIGLRCSMVF